jgi:hypothetical protein
VTVAPRRTLHVRFNDLADPEPVQPGREYASLIEADVPIVAQHTRLDSRQAENADDDHGLRRGLTAAWPLAGATSTGGSTLRSPTVVGSSR